MERLNRQMVAAAVQPTRIIQFGEGNFLRGFVDWHVQKMNEAGAFGGGVAVVQPLTQGRIADLERQDRLYTVLLEGIQDGHTVKTHEIVTVINQTLNPYDDWEGYLALAENPHTDVIVSNTTDAGIAIDPTDRAGTAPPNGFPAKLAHLMRRRFESGLPGWLLLPCELIDDNGAALRQSVLQCVEAFGWGDELAHWIETENQFCSTLVDRITPGFPADQAASLWDEWGYRDDLIVKAEPFGLWAIQAPDALQDDRLASFARPDNGLDVVITPDLRPYHDRKVYLLNAPHTTIAQLARLAGLTSVGETIADPDFRAFVDAQMRHEIMPTIDLPAAELDSFAASIIERFENPFVHHALDSIALNSVSKFNSRLLPIIEKNLQLGQPLPPRTCLALAALLVIYSGADGQAQPIDTPDVMAAFGRAKQGDYARDVLADTGLWGEDLTQLPGLLELVRHNYATLQANGARALVRSLP